MWHQRPSIRVFVRWLPARCRLRTSSLSSVVGQIQVLNYEHQFKSRQSWIFCCRTKNSEQSAYTSQSAWFVIWQFLPKAEDVEDVYGYDSGYVAQIKQQKSKRWYYLSAHWLYGDVLISNITFLIFSVLVVRHSHCPTVVLTSHFKLLSFFTLITSIGPIAQLSLTNPRDALHHDKRQNFKTVTWP